MKHNLSKITFKDYKMLDQLKPCWHFLTSLGLPRTSDTTLKIVWKNFIQWREGEKPSELIENVVKLFIHFSVRVSNCCCYCKINHNAN